ncbi:acyl carrier protein [Hydrogenophaga sp.]|uniref:acyl carrier protein n=1 Tax=Hydrogenophaga sp. TaxID=1904254 RepID=UPI003F6BDE22
MNVTEQVLRVLDEALSLQGRAQAFRRETPLLGALPELDSMAVLALITGLENHFGVAFSDDDMNGTVFATVGSVSDLVQQALNDQGA